MVCASHLANADVGKFRLKGVSLNCTYLQVASCLLRLHALKKRSLRQTWGSSVVIFHGVRMFRISSLYSSMAFAILAIAMTLFCWVTPMASAQTFEEALASAQKGDSRAQFDVGLATLNYSSDPEYVMMAMDFLTRAADQGYRDAQSFLGTTYETGSYVPSDPVLSTKYYAMAANQGDTFAQSRMGFAYHNGIGVSKDASLSLKWHTAAAENGSAASQTALSIIYADGVGVPKNYVEAFKWQHAAAVQGDPNHQIILAWYYFRGQGTPKSYTHAYMWFSLAASQGNEDAERMFSKFEEFCLSMSHCLIVDM